MPRLSKTRKAIVTAAMRESIYEAAASVLCKYGIVGTTMSRVAEAAQVTKSNLYNYFRDKNEILQFFNTRIVEPCLRAIEEVVQGDLPAPQKLETILRTAWGYGVQHKGLIRLVVEGGHDSKLRRAIRPRLMKVYSTVIEQGIQDGVFRPHNPEHTSRLLLGAMTELFELLADGASEVEVSEYVEVLVGAVLHGFTIHVGSGRGHLPR